jgi:hypothetical protein
LVLDGKEIFVSSYYLEDVATEFQVQGLELDWHVLLGMETLDILQMDGHASLLLAVSGIILIKKKENFI